MVNQEILGGLKSSLKRGESLQKAMTTFYNAGYKKEEIEEAARVLQQEKIQAPTIPQEVKETKSKKQEKIKLLPTIAKPSPKKVSAYGPLEKGPGSEQVQASSASEYGGKRKKKAGRWLLIAIIAVAVIFIGLLIAFLLST